VRKLGLIRMLLLANLTQLFSSSRRREMKIPVLLRLKLTKKRLLKRLLPLTLLLKRLLPPKLAKEPNKLLPLMLLPPLLLLKLKKLPLLLRRPLRNSCPLNLLVKDSDCCIALFT